MYIWEVSLRTHNRSAGRSTDSRDVWARRRCVRILLLLGRLVSHGCGPGPASLCGCLCVADFMAGPCPTTLGASISRSIDRSIDRIGPFRCGIRPGLDRFQVMPPPQPVPSNRNRPAHDPQARACLLPSQGARLQLGRLRVVTAAANASPYGLALGAAAVRVKPHAAQATLRADHPCIPKSHPVRRGFDRSSVPLLSVSGVFPNLNNDRLRIPMTGCDII